MGTGVEVAIMGDGGKVLSRESPGEVVIRGPNVTAGYENNPEANAAAFTDGWFRTGDEGVIDERGYLHLIGRIKELINHGGEKIAPREIEETLLLHPSVAEAVAFGVPHAVWGEEVGVAVVLRAPVADRDLVGHCREHLADYKVPKKIYVTEEIPRTATGKIQRRFVAEAFIGTAP
jgi:acyl-CoA synthetase (AMP-forming)/AMP-acid ligase II